MSRFFVLGEEGVGPGGQIYWRHIKGRTDNGTKWYNLYLDKQRLGQIINTTGFEKWVAIAEGPESEIFGLRMMEGFATRWHASTFIIKWHGYWLRDHRENRIINKVCWFKTAERLVNQGVITKEEAERFLEEK